MCCHPTPLARCGPRGPCGGGGAGGGRHESPPPSCPALPPASPWRGRSAHARSTARHVTDRARAGAKPAKPRGCRRPGAPHRARPGDAALPPAPPLAATAPQVRVATRPDSVAWWRRPPLKAQSRVGARLHPALRSGNPCGSRFLSHVTGPSPKLTRAQIKEAALREETHEDSRLSSWGGAAGPRGSGRPPCGARRGAVQTRLSVSAGAEARARVSGSPTQTLRRLRRPRLSAGGRGL